MPILQESEAVEPILTQLRGDLRKGQSLQGCCQILMEALVKMLPKSLHLARAYATIPFHRLPERDRTAIGLRTGRALENDTRVLSLMGTAGSRPEWNNRYKSQDHLAIPLFSEESVQELPMVSNLIQQLGQSGNWYRKVGGAGLLKEDFGVFTDTFFVADAASSVDSAGRLLIPAQDFVRQYGIRAVLGVGGEFSNEGIVVACILFTTETLPGTPKWLLRIPLLLAGAAKPLVTQGKLYTP